jgi:hypothetical protein
MNTLSPFKSLSKIQQLGKQGGESPCELKPSSSAQPSNVTLKCAWRGSNAYSTSFQLIEQMVVTCLRLFSACFATRIAGVGFEVDGGVEVGSCANVANNVS